MNKNVFSNLRTPGLLGKKPIIGLTMFVIGTLIFIILAINLVNNSPLIKWDLSLANSFHNLALKSPTFVIDTMIAGYYIGSCIIWITAIFLIVYFLYKRFWCELFMSLASLGLAPIIFLILSNIFKRPRPFLSYDKLIWTGSPTIPGFPSGHATSIIVCLGFLVYLLVPRIKSHIKKVLMILVALLIVLYIGLSRIYIGDHYPLDIIAGYAVGVAWFGLACTSIELLFQRHYLKKRNKNLKHGKR